MVGLEHIADTPIESFDHAIGFGRSGFGQPVLYAQFPAQLIKLMVATGLALTRGKQSVGELLAVVAQQLDDLERTGLVQRLQKAARTRRCLVCQRRLNIAPPCRSAVKRDRLESRWIIRWPSRAGGDHWFNNTVALRLGEALR